MALNTSSILNQVVSHAYKLGVFERVNQHEPKNAPTGKGLTTAVWIDRIEPLARASGLAATSARLVINVRIFSAMRMEPQDAIDPRIADAVSVLMTAYSGDFDLGGQARNIDLLGQFGPGLAAQAGYLDQDHVVFRVMTITLPVIVNDAWTQEA